MPTVYLWGGATTTESFWVRGRVDGRRARLAVAPDPGLADPVYFGPANATDDKVVSLRARRLEPATTYHYAFEVDGKLNREVTGRIRTLPPLDAPADFTVAAFSCAGLYPHSPGIGDVLAPQRLSNTATFRTVVDHHDPIQVVRLGDDDYYDLGSGRHKIKGGACVANFRRAIDDQLAQPNQAYLNRMCAVQKERDDHDGGPNNHDRAGDSIEAFLQVYRERVPHYELTVPRNNFQSWRIGPAQFVLWDSRSDRDPNEFGDIGTKSMLGPNQRFAFAQVLARSSADILVIYSPSAWYSGSEDSWARFGAEQQWVLDRLDAHGWTDRVFIVQGDIHALGLDTGTHTPGGIPVLQASAMDSWSGKPGSRWDTGPSEPGGDQYGTIHIADADGDLQVTMSAWRQTDRRRTHTFTVPAKPRTPSADITLLDIHEAVHELTARVESTERRQETVRDRLESRLLTRELLLRYITIGVAAIAIVALVLALVT